MKDEREYLIKRLAEAEHLLSLYLATCEGSKAPILKRGKTFMDLADIDELARGHFAKHRTRKSLVKK